MSEPESPLSGYWSVVVTGPPGRYGYYAARGGTPGEAEDAVRADPKALEGYTVDPSLTQPLDERRGTAHIVVAADGSMIGVMGG